jgi:hypothetical protein
LNTILLEVSLNKGGGAIIGSFLEYPVGEKMNLSKIKVLLQISFNGSGLAINQKDKGSHTFYVCVVFYLFDCLFFVKVKGNQMPGKV